MSFFTRLFGGGGAAEAAKPAAETDHKGFAIVATPQPEGGQYRLHGTITKIIDDETKTHTLIRADIFPDADQCAQVTIRKAKQVIDEQGEQIFG